MPRRSRLFSLSALTQAYRRNLKALASAARPVRAKTPSRTPAKTPNKAIVQAKAPTPTHARSRTAPQGEWLNGVAPGPAGARRFSLYIPAGLVLQPGEKRPLLVMLHGCGQTGRDLAAVTRMNRLAARERFLVLYPEQERLANVHLCWNWFEERSGKAQAEAATLLAAVDQLARRQPIDLSCVAVVGLSAGASMAAMMAARYPGRICAVVMHSGAAPGTADSAATAMSAMRGLRPPHLPAPAQQPFADPSGAAASAPGSPRLPALMVLHGDADRVVSRDNAAAAAALWAQALGARAGATRRVQRGQRHAMRVTEYKAQGRTVVVLREVEGLAHAWSGGAARLPYSDPVGPDASALVWAFVARQFPKNSGV